MSDLWDQMYRLDPDIREEPFMQHVRRIAREGGWAEYHTYDSRKSTEGFPDLVLVREGVLIFAELKTNHRTSKPTPAQLLWIARLSDVAAASEGAVKMYLWRPNDFPNIARLLLRVA